MESHVIRSLLAARSKLVDIRTQVRNQVRGLLKVFGLVVGKAGGRGFETRVQELCAGHVELKGIVDSLLEVLRTIKRELAILDRTLSGYTHSNTICRLLMTAPGVGPVTAAFITAVDDPDRFARSSSVGAYLILTSRRYQSGEVNRAGRISKCGDERVRSYLYEAAGVLLTRVEKWSKLKAWASAWPNGWA